ncbi:GTPase-associated system all-helical protein GASH [Archangium lansingense]|uniref:GTPase-associated system all-helical protein GASH n=1 Tax=Archangium lansingense TaxID=2995310 RepID=UPI003B7DA0C9
MTGLLTDLLAAGLIENLGGDDERFAKVERAAKAVAGELRTTPLRIIGAILAGLDPDVPAEDPVIAQAEQALVHEWKSMNSVHTSPPIKLFRAILLEACAQAAEGKNAAILWLTAADTLPLVRMGKEEPTVRRMLETVATRTEELALVVPSIPANKRQTIPKVEAKPAAQSPTPLKVERQNLLSRVAATAGPNYRNNNPAPPNANPNWAFNQSPNWSWEFADRLHVVLADELDALAQAISKHQGQISQQVNDAQTELVGTFGNALTSQQRWVQDSLEASEARQKSARLRLDVLWWSEALYSQSVRCSYRELSPALAAVVMAIDLLDHVVMPTPASVSYLLSETVSRLPEADFSRVQVLPELLGALRKSRERLPREWLEPLSPPPAEGRLSLRDLVILTLGDRELDLDKSVKRAGLSGEISMSLPGLARALFRQEQAVRLAGSAR